MTNLSILIILAPLVGIIAIIIMGIVAWLSGSVGWSTVSAPAGFLFMSLSLSLSPPTPPPSPLSETDENISSGEGFKKYICGIVTIAIIVIAMHYCFILLYIALMNCVASISLESRETLQSCCGYYHHYLDTHLH